MAEVNSMWPDIESLAGRPGLVSDFTVDFCVNLPCLFQVLNSALLLSSNRTLVMPSRSNYIHYFTVTFLAFSMYKSSITVYCL